MTTQLKKYTQRLLDSRGWPQLLIFKDKHSNSYYLINDMEALGRACLEVLKSRLNPQYGYIYDPSKEKIYGLVDELTQEAAEALPEPYRAQALQARKNNERLRRDRDEEIEQYCAAKKALKEKDGMAAYLVLDRRKDYEYEGFEFETIGIP